MRVVLEVRGPADDRPRHRVVRDFPVTLGRGYDNDIILTDPHVDEMHLRIEREEGGVFTFTDAGSVNTTLLNGEPRHAGRLSSGDTLTVGTTSLRVYLPGHRVEPPVRLHRKSSAILWLTRPVNIWASFLLGVALVTAWAYAGMWMEDRGVVLAAAASSAAIAVFVWSALWAVASKFIRHSAHFMMHVALASLCLAAGVLMSWLVSAAGFLLDENLFSVILGYVMNAVLLTLLLYGGLSLATHMKRRKRLMSAAFFSFGLALGIFSVSMITSAKFSPDPLYPYRLHPFLGEVVPARTPTDFMKDAAKLFKSDTFKKAEKAK